MTEENGAQKSIICFELLHAEILAIRRLIECHVRSDLSLPSARANQIAISSFCPLFHLLCPLFHFCARYFNKNSKATNQSDLRNIAQHVIKAMFRSIFGPVRGIDPILCEKCLGKSNWTDRESGNEIPFQKWWRSAEQVIHIRSGAFQKAI